MPWTQNSGKYRKEKLDEVNQGSDNITAWERERKRKTGKEERRMQKKDVKKVGRFEISLETMETIADKEQGNKRIIWDYKGTEKEIMSETDKGKNNPNVNTVKNNKIC